MAFDWLMIARVVLGWLVIAGVTVRLATFSTVAKLNADAARLSHEGTKSEGNTALPPYTEQKTDHV